MPETVAPPAAAITEAPPAARSKPAANTAHKRQISEAIPRNKRPIARQARPEPAKGDAREGRQQRCRIPLSYCKIPNFTQFKIPDEI
jgi:hypothetical protein